MHRREYEAGPNLARQIQFLARRFSAISRMPARRFHPFVRDGWNMFDVVVVSLSLIALGPISLPVNVLRSIRAFRVIRLFGRVGALRDIVSALTAAIMPVLNAFLILFIIAAICADTSVSEGGERGGRVWVQCRYVWVGWARWGGYAAVAALTLPSRRTQMPFSEPPSSPTPRLRASAVSTWPWCPSSRQILHESARVRRQIRLAA